MNPKNILLIEPNADKILTTFASEIERTSPLIALSGTEANIAMIEKNDPMCTATCVGFGNGEDFRNRTENVCGITFSTADIILAGEINGTISNATATTLYNQLSSEEHDYDSFKKGHVNKLQNKLRRLGQRCDLASNFNSILKNALKSPH